MNPNSNSVKQTHEGANEVGGRPLILRSLCIGLDIAWFGGSKSDPDSWFDCIASMEIGGIDLPRLNLERVALGKERDPDSKQTLEAISALIQQYPFADEIVFAIDAPLQATDRGLKQRLPNYPKGEKGSVVRRACENVLEAGRQQIDKSVSVTKGWKPNIQPGAPLAPRVERLLDGLKKLDFDVWEPRESKSSRLAIECFPAEAIWSAKCLGGYRESLTVSCAKAYKDQKGNSLSKAQVEALMKDSLFGFSKTFGEDEFWESAVSEAIQWILIDTTWQRSANGLFRGGKLLDDVVDTMICLATSISFVKGSAHVWFDPAKADDGHIIGPGFRANSHWRFPEFG